MYRNIKSRIFTKDDVSAYSPCCCGVNKKFETIELRRQVRIEVAKRNSEERTNILNARQSDNALFHRLVR